jgi:type I restriction enzyme S subunit
MNNWKETELSNIIEIINGYAFKSQDFKDHGIPIIKIKNVKPQEIKLNELSYVDKETVIGKEKWKINKGDILITMSGNRSDGSPDSWVGKVAEFNKDGVYYLNQRLSILKPIVDYVNSTFLAYLLSSWDYQLELISLSNSSGGQANISPQIVKQLKVTLPSKVEQENIAEVLTSLDKKRDLLHRNNKTLEELAETLFRQWFESVENEDSTRLMDIADVATVQNGYSFKSSEFISEQLDTIEVLKMGHISTDGGLRPSPKKDFVKRSEKYNKWILNKRDIILAMTDMKDNVVILGVPALIDHDNKYVLNQRVGRIFLKENSLLESILILYMQMKEKNFISELQSKGNSGVQVNLGTDTIRQTKIVVPTKENQKKILPQLSSIFDKLEHNRVQVQSLENLRDTLLPKLMSGTVRVEN